MIKFGDFRKLQILIGTVIKAERIPKTDKLLRLIIDFGTTQMQIVAGFGFKFQPEYLLGKQVPVITNIEPTEIRGVKSEGILLGVDDQGEPYLLVPEVKVNNGSVVR